MTRNQCSERVYSGDRSDWGGHPCGTSATIQTDDGKWWCKRHTPDAKAERQQKRKDAYHSEAEARDASEAEINSLLTRIGIKGYPRTHFAAKFGAPCTEASIDVAELRRYADWLQAQIPEDGPTRTD